MAAMSALLRRLTGLTFALPLTLLIGLVVVGAGARPAAATQPRAGDVEPGAGSWHTWLLTSSGQFRPGAPPDAAASRSELDRLHALADQRDSAASDQIAFWDTGAPSYRWNELAISEALQHNLPSNYGTRAMALVHIAISDAMIATWDAKYAYMRPRPTELDPSLSAALAYSNESLVSV